ncbi:DUF7342 family protein [Halovenus sp. HT40]|uniref:DUF7342 family protein n=1 Tax=Halovenus sp. HT40 TaxID=3126691 RepID=UPI00300F7720
MTDETSPNGPDEFPSEGELPDDPVAVDDIDPFSVDDDDFENIDDIAAAEWKAQTSPSDRVRSVMRTAYEPMAAATVAEHSLTSEQTAREQLRSLVERGYVTETASPDSKATVYRRATDSLALEQARRILDETDADTLSTRVVEMREQLREYSEQFNANSPDAAVRADAEINSETLLEWRTTRRNLVFANVALSIANAERIVERDTSINEMSDEEIEELHPTSDGK